MPDSKDKVLVHYENNKKCFCKGQNKTDEERLKSYATN